MESNQTLIDIINQQNTKIQQLENLLKDQHSNFNNNSKQEIICLFCNQIFTTQDILNHVHQNKDHSDHCIHIDGIKDQLLDINNNSSSSNNDNIFKNRIETLWLSLKKLSATHSSLNSKMNEITNHFKIYYDYLMSKEHSLKKQIQDDIDLVNSDITHIVNEFKSIINIVNINNAINNISLEDKNNNSDLGLSLGPEESYFEDTTKKYTLSSIIESIQQSKSYNNFIDNNINTLFYKNNNYFKEYNNNLPFLFLIENHNRTFNSSLSKPIEIKSHTIKIDENLHIVKVKPLDHVYDQLQKIIEESIVLISETPSALVRFGDFQRIKNYYNRNKIYKLEYNHNSKSKLQIEIKETIIEILKSNRIDILEYLFNELHFDIATHFKLDLKLFRTIDKFDLLIMSTIYSNLETIQFIESFGINKNTKWKYETCLEVSPLSNNMDILQYFSTKVMGMINSVEINNIHDSKSINNIFVSANAALLGHIDMIKWISRNTPFLFSFRYLDHYNIFSTDATRNRYFFTIRWLNFNNRTEGYSTNAMNNAAMNGHLETIKWFHENRSEGCTAEAMDWAAMNGHLETIKWLHENRTEGCTTDAMNYAARNGHLETIKWLHHNRTEGCTIHAMNNAAMNGDFEAAEWLHQNRTEGCTTDAMDYAAENGHLEIIKWLHHNRTEGCTTDAMNYAARNGHLEIIKWLRVVLHCLHVARPGQHIIV